MYVCVHLRENVVKIRKSDIYCFTVMYLKFTQSLREVSALRMFENSFQKHKKLVNLRLFSLILFNMHSLYILADLIVGHKPSEGKIAFPVSKIFWKWKSYG